MVHMENDDKIPKEYDWSYTEMPSGRDLRWPVRPDHPEICELAVRMTRVKELGGEATALINLMERLGICPLTPRRGD